MKKYQTVALYAAVVTGLFWLFGPDYMKDHVVGILTFAPSEERQCFNFWRDEFEDSESGYVDNSFVNSDGVLKVKLMAKNKMGGYVSVWVGCPLENGRFSSYKAGIERDKDQFKRIRGY